MNEQEGQKKRTKQAMINEQAKNATVQFSGLTRKWRRKTRKTVQKR